MDDMAKGQTNISGLHFAFRAGTKCDALRVQVHANGKSFWISPKHQKTLKHINDYLKGQALRNKEAELDLEFQALRQRLSHELKDAHGLKEYKIREVVALKRKGFNFGEALDSFLIWKEDVSTGVGYRARLENFWLPFFLEKGCTHPRDFRSWRNQALDHLKTSKKLRGDERYSVHSRATMAAALNEFMRFLEEREYVDSTEKFSINARITREQVKRGLTSRSRKNDTYTLDDLYDIKKGIDTAYKDDPHWKRRAYALLFGLCTGLRRGNILGLKARDLYPNADVPYFETRDNIVAGWSRGVQGKITLELSTKTFVGTAKVPLIQPDRNVAVEIAEYLKLVVKPDEYLLGCAPDTVRGFWKKIAEEVGFKFIHPHGWKHSYATIGGNNLTAMYMGNPRFLQMCCLHEKFETTQKYLKQTGDQLLEAFEKKKS